MTDRSPGTVAVLGLGAMGRSLAAAQLEAGRAVTMWNRTSGRSGGLTERGAVEAQSAHAAAAAGGPVVVCLYDHASVHETLDPIADALVGRTVVNLTTTTPDEARELAVWAEGHGITYLDGAIMAT
ncbi:MAG TPA: NAD(P)-binding domain-containing protein, partial [Jiangellaceae bacterium]|nr:NAD(P)-binding domain-containing protein [Jiangellaceae bacterium]